MRVKALDQAFSSRVAEPCRFGFTVSLMERFRGFGGRLVLIDLEDSREYRYRIYYRFLLKLVGLVFCGDHL